MLYNDLEFRHSEVLNLKYNIAQLFEKENNILESRKCTWDTNVVQMRYKWDTSVVEQSTLVGNLPYLLVSY